jgi:hypothetical protein
MSRYLVTRRDKGSHSLPAGHHGGLTCEVKTVGALHMSAVVDEDGRTIEKGEADESPKSNDFGRPTALKNFRPDDEIAWVE